MSENKPEATIRDGNLKATIWRNEGERGPFFNVTISKTYRDQNGELRDTHSLGSDDLLRASELTREVHHVVNKLYREQARSPDRQDRQNDAPDRDRNDRNRDDRPRKR